MITSGIAGPRCGGVQLVKGRISLLNGAIDISKLYLLFNIRVQAAASRLFMLSQRSKSANKKCVKITGNTNSLGGSQAR